MIGRTLISRLEELRQFKLGLEGERATGQELDQLTLEGCRVFHDVPFPNGGLPAPDLDCATRFEEPNVPENILCVGSCIENACPNPQQRQYEREDWKKPRIEFTGYKAT